MKKTLCLFLLSCLFLFAARGQNAARQEFVRKYKHIAVREMERTGIPASISLAQGILESACGQSELARKAHNHFGIKCHNDWTGATYHMDDDAKNECFRKYRNPEQSWIDHSEFLTTRPRYAGLFQLPATDYKAWARGLKAAGYATNPQYADLLIKIIEEEGLHQYDHAVKPRRGLTITADQFAEHVGGATSTTTTSSSGYRNREEMRNGIICIEAKAGDSYQQIASYYGIKVKKLLQYNDKTDNSLRTGEIVYLKKKKTQAARGYEFHRVKPGDTLYGIAQQYGVRLKSLLKNNYLDADSRLMEGEKVYLRKKAPLF